ncbi:MAG: BspA family leucine-rich repeat surface protein [Clostridia bacterium]|nr:BspA family leucine-rich repeat surface protein [Clostridia bacterium]
MKKQTKVLILLVSVCLLAVLLPVFSGAADGEVYAVYNSTDDVNTLTFLVGQKVSGGVKRTADGVTYSGTVYSGFADTTFANAQARPWNAYGSSVKEVHILDEFKPVSTALWFRTFSSATVISGLEKLDMSAVESMRMMFFNCQLVEELNVSSWNTAKVTDMSSVFYNNKKLVNLDLSSWSLANVANTASMFYGCSKLETLTVNVNKWASSKIAQAGSMFGGCAKLESITFGKWTPVSGASVSNMFSGCNALTTLDISRWDVKNLTDLSEFFKGCSQVATLDVSGWNTAKVTNMSKLFSGCAALTALDLSAWSTAKVEDMSNLFSGCAALTALDLSAWSTAKVEDMSGMFQGCSSLATLEINNWGTKLTKVSEMDSMFSGCSSLQTLDLSKWKAGSVYFMSNMFAGCTSLSTLSIGTGFNYLRNVGLPDMEEVVSPYTGYWTNPNGEVRHYLTSSQLICASAETVENNTWVWETVGTPRSIAGAKVSGDGVYRLYTGEVQTPDYVTVKLDYITLTEGEDFTVVGFEDNVNAGSAKIYVTAAGENYVGDAVGSYTISARPIYQLDINIESQQYTGREIVPSMTITMGDVELEQGVDYEVRSSWPCTDPGEAHCYINGLGNYGGQAYKSFTIVTRNVVDANITSVDSVFTGEAQTTTLTAHLADREYPLTEGTDYNVVRYLDNVNAGTAYVRISGIGKFSGMTDVPFTIEPRSLTEATVGALSVTYTGAELETTGTGKYGNYTLQQERDFTVDGYDNNVNAGSATIILTGTGNFKDTVSVRFTILPKDLSAAEVFAEDQKHTGKALTPPVTVVLDGEPLDAENYSVAYGNNTDAGTAVITVTGKGNYKGVATGTFKIEKTKLSLWERILAFFRKIIAFFKGSSK